MQFLCLVCRKLNEEEEEEEIKTMKAGSISLGCSMQTELPMTRASLHDLYGMY